MGQLVPVGLTPVLPGDTFQQSTSALIRVSPLVAPVMHPVVVRIHHWFIPNRIIWNGWENFITGGPDGNNADTPPTILSQAAKGTLLDYFGIPPVLGASLNAMPVYAFNMLYNEWYRDQDLVSERNITDTTIPDCAWEKDYFTSSRPWTQKGDEVTLPLAGQAPVLSNATAPNYISAASEDLGTMQTSPGNFYPVWSTGAPTQSSEVRFNNNTGLVADLTQTQQISINDFRYGFGLQRYKEARARYGSRYTEYLAYQGVKSSDARLQRPEYLGGGKQTISFSEVLGTFDGTNEGESVLGQLGGHGIAALRSNKYRKFFEEHGYVITVMSVRPKTIYSHGVPREFLKTTKEEYFQPELEHIGQQEIYQGEVYLDGAQDKNTFGWQDRYSEYRHQPSNIAGDFRDVLNYWHMAREFATEPALNSDFINCKPTNRIFKDRTGTDTLLCMVNHNIKARRKVKRKQSSRVI